MADATPTTLKTPSTKTVPGQLKKQGGWFQKIPKEILFSPGGMVLIFLALIIEIIDWIPIPIIDNIWELPLELMFLVFLAMITKIPFKAMVIPFIIERIPLVNDIVPTWLLRLFI
ncbi:MAG: hypothetical protein ABIB55_02290 [Candidatus Nealsonbacteria bacterium]